MILNHKLNYNPITKYDIKQQTQEQIDNDKLDKLMNQKFIDAKKQQNIQNLCVGLSVEH